MLAQMSYYASLCLYAFSTYYAQNYASIIWKTLASDHQCSEIRIFVIYYGDDCFYYSSVIIYYYASLANALKDVNKDLLLQLTVVRE